MGFSPLGSQGAQEPALPGDRHQPPIFETGRYPDHGDAPGYVFTLTYGHSCRRELMVDGQLLCS
jgi:hypothetical protein